MVGTWQASELDSHELAFLMTGQRFTYRPLPPLAAKAAPLLEIRKLSRGEQFRNIDLTLHQGEIVSITGLLGQENGVMPQSVRYDATRKRRNIRGR